MKTRKISLGHRCTVTLCVLLFGVCAPIGCAQTPKNLFSKVWGPDRITFKEAVGLGDSRSKKKTNTSLADEFGNRSSKLADNDSKTIGQKIGGFGKVLRTGFKRTNKNDESVKKTASANPQTKTRIEDARTRLASNYKPNRDSGLRNLGKTSAAETLRINRIRNDLKTKRNPTQSLHATLSPEKKNSLDKSRTNPFAVSLETQNSNQSRRSVESVNTKTQGNTLAQTENPFADLRTQPSQKPVTKPLEESTDSPSSNQFVAEFDDSWDNMLRDQQQYSGNDESDETDELDEFGGTQPAQSLASSRSENTGSSDTNPFQKTIRNRRAINREHVDRLMQSAHSELAKGRTADALSYARHAKTLAANEGVFFGPKEERPGDLVLSIRDKMANTISQAEKVPAANPVIVPRTRKNTIRETVRSSQRPENTNPFAGSEPFDTSFAALPRPPEQTAPVPKQDSFAAFENSNPVPKQDSFTAFENSNPKAIEPKTTKISLPSHAELQTVIVEVSDPFDGMIVESETVPPRIPEQSVQKKSAPRPIIRSADAQTTKYRGPKTIPRKVLKRLKSSIPRPADVDKKRAVQEQQSRTRSRKKPNRSSSQDKKPKRANSNRGARIITINYEVPRKLDNVWYSKGTKKQEYDEPALLIVSDAEQTEEQNSVVVTSEQPVVTSRENFFHIGGSSDENSQVAAGLVDRDENLGYKADSQISELREQFPIFFCLTIAGFIGFGIRFRYSLRLLWQKFASR